MALPWDLVKDAVQESADAYTINDNTVYGQGGNPARADRANILFVTKTDKNGTRTLLSNTPNDADPVVVSSWDVVTTQDGWNEWLLASVNVHQAGQSYADAGTILYYGGVFYITKSAVPISTDPPNATYYDVITAASLYTTYLDNESIEWVEVDTLDSARIEEKINEWWEEFSDQFLANKCPLEQYSVADQLSSLLESANAALLNGRPQDMEEIIRGIETYYLNAA